MHLNKIKPPSLTGNNLNEITKNKIGQANKLKRVLTQLKKQQPDSKIFNRQIINIKLNIQKTLNYSIFIKGLKFNVF